jgi:hypothetical protein
MRISLACTFAVLLGGASCHRSAAEASADGGDAGSAHPTHALAPVYALALQGDMRAALDRLHALSVDQMDDDERRQRACILERFESPSPAQARSSDPLLESVMVAYRRYWTQVLMGRASRDEGRASLVGALHGALGGADAASTGPEDVFDTLGTALTARGYHSIRGVTAPYQDFLAWRDETRTTYTVSIPEGERRVEVVMMHDFASLGWEGFATCDHSYPGGWAESDRLFCMADSYDTKTEHFTISYLAHETQHFADYERFPKLASGDLEYRAKLVEIIESRQTTKSLVALFATQASDHRDLPHPYADHCVIRDLQRALGRTAAEAGSAWWDSLSDQDVRAAAERVFDENTNLLVARGAETVSSVL